MSANVLDAVNQPQQALASFTVRGPGGNVVFTSKPVPLALTVQTALITANLGTLDTTGFGKGAYTINVTVTESGRPPKKRVRRHRSWRHYRY